MPKQSSKQIASKQSKLFMQKARELGLPEDEEAFDRALKKIASAPPNAAEKQKPKTKSK